MKEEARTDNQMKRFLGIKCVHCGITLKRKSTAEPFAAAKTCVVCGQNTHFMQDIPLDEIQKISKEACEALVKGKWAKGLELARKTEKLAIKYFSMPVLELTEVHISIWKCLWLIHGSMRLVKSL